MANDIKEQIQEQVKAGLEEHGIWGELRKLSVDDRERLKKALDSILASALGLPTESVDELRKEERELLRKQSDAPIAVADAPHLPFFPFVIPVVARMHPQDFPVLASIRRRIAPQGTEAQWVAIGNVWERQGFVGGPPDVALGESPSTPLAHKTDYVRLSEPFKVLQVWKKVTFLAQAAARTFADLLLLESTNAAIALYAGEEALVIAGDPSTDPDAFKGLRKVIIDGYTKGSTVYRGVVKSVNTDGQTTSLNPFNIYDVYTVAQAIYERGSAYPKMMVVHPRLIPSLVKDWLSQIRVTVAPGVPATAPEVVAAGRVIPMVFPGIGEIQVVPCRWVPEYTITVQGNQVKVSDILLIDPDEELPGQLTGYPETGRAIEMWDLQPTQIGWFAPITLTYRIAAFKFTTLVVRAPVLQGALTGVPIPQV